MEAAYYNAIYGMWEFLVEPVESRHHGKVSHRPWELFFDYTTVECNNAIKGNTKGSNSDEAESDVAGVHDQEKPPTYMSITLQSNVNFTSAECCNMKQDFHTLFFLNFRTLWK